jgi:restriction system protein
MTVSEIYQAIVNDQLYTFNARNPVGVVGTQLRRHAEGANFPAAARTKLFGRTEDGKYYLLG